MAGKNITERQRLAGEKTRGVVILSGVAASRREAAAQSKDLSRPKLAYGRSYRNRPYRNVR